MPSLMTLIQAGIVLMLAASAMGAQEGAPAQKLRPCGTIESVEFNSGNPFTALRISKSVNSNPNAS
jgi:hypothetical protein